MQDNLINRQGAINEILRVYEYEYPTATGAFDEFVTKIIPSIINNLPSVQPELNCKNCVFRTGYGAGIDEGVSNALPKKMKEGE